MEAQTQAFPLTSVTSPGVCLRMATSLCASTSPCDSWIRTACRLAPRTPAVPGADASFRWTIWSKQVMRVLTGMPAAGICTLMKEFRTDDQEVVNHGL